MSFVSIWRITAGATRPTSPPISDRLRESLDDGSGTVSDSTASRAVAAASRLRRGRQHRIRRWRNPLAGGSRAYDHIRLRPALTAAPDDPELAARRRSILTAEAIVLTFVVIVTAWLVAAAS